MTADLLLPIVSRREPLRWRNGPLLIAAASTGAGVSMDMLDTQALEEKIDRLIRICDRLDDENRALREQQAGLMAERAALVEKSELARSRVEAMIARLRAMEVDT